MAVNKEERESGVAQIEREGNGYNQNIGGGSIETEKG